MRPPFPDGQKTVLTITALSARCAPWLQSTQALPTTEEVESDCVSIDYRADEQEEHPRCAARAAVMQALSTHRRLNSRTTRHRTAIVHG
jgi:hypothetical protein